MIVIPDNEQNNPAMMPVPVHQLHYQKCALGIGDKSNMIDMHKQYVPPFQSENHGSLVNGKKMQNIQDSGPETRIRSMSAEPKYLTIVNSHVVMVIHYEGSFLL
jgi:hypothetical protein